MLEHATLPTQDELLQSFAELYWLKPYDIPWDALTAYQVASRIPAEGSLLDLGCGDGLFSALMFGARLATDADRFCGAQPRQQAILPDQQGDIYERAWIPRLARPPARQIAMGLDLKPHQLAVAKHLGLYQALVQGSFEAHQLPSSSYDAVFSVFAFYWADDLDRATAQVARILKDGGEFLVTLPSEHLYGLHLAARLAEPEHSAGAASRYFESLDGGRRRLTTRHARSQAEWREHFARHSLQLIDVVPIVNQLMFTMQDLGQRPFLPELIRHANTVIAPEQRDALKRYLCERFYPEFLKPFYQGLEGDPGVQHAYYSIHLRKAGA